MTMEEKYNKIVNIAQKYDFMTNDKLLINFSTLDELAAIDSYIDRKLNFNKDEEAKKAIKEIYKIINS
jgi:hypothetical protein